MKMRTTCRPFLLGETPDSEMESMRQILCEDVRSGSRYALTGPKEKQKGKGIEVCRRMTVENKGLGTRPSDVEPCQMGKTDLPPQTVLPFPEPEYTIQTSDSAFLASGIFAFGFSVTVVLRVGLA